MRAAEHRKSQAKERAAERIELDKAWHEEFDNPDHKQDAGKSWKKTGEPLPGIEDDLVQSPTQERQR
eukprot:198142-Prorocentrum_lima.AAC.1